MKPYLVHNTWVDLDHVLAIHDSVSIRAGAEWAGLKPHAEVRCEMMFRNDSVTIWIGFITDAQLAGLDHGPLNQILADFIAAWKSKDANPSPSPMSTAYP